MDGKIVAKAYSKYFRSLAYRTCINWPKCIHPQSTGKAAIYKVNHLKLAVLVTLNKILILKTCLL